MILKDNRLPLINRSEIYPDEDLYNSSSSEVIKQHSKEDKNNDIQTEASTESFKEIFVRFNSMFLKRFDSLDDVLQKMDKRAEKEQRKEDKDEEGGIKKGIQNINKNLVALIKKGSGGEESGGFLDDILKGFMSSPIGLALETIAGAIAAGFIVKNIFGIESWKDVGEKLKEGFINFTSPTAIPGVNQTPETDTGSNIFDWGKELNGKSKDGKVHIQGSNRAQEAMDYFQKMGLTKEQSSGIVGNLMHESGMNEKAVGDNGLAYGLGQWHPDRQSYFKEAYGKNMKDSSSFTEQLAFVWHELNTTRKDALDAIKKSKTSEDSSNAMMDKFEKPGDLASREQRIAFSNQIYKDNIEEEKRRKELAKQKIETTKDFIQPTPSNTPWAPTPIKNKGPWWLKSEQDPLPEVSGPLSLNRFEQTAEKDFVAKNEQAIAQTQQSQQQPQITTIDNSSTHLVTKVEPTVKDETYHRHTSMTGSYDAFRV